jgi:hypothetical protein
MPQQEFFFNLSLRDGAYVVNEFLPAGTYLEE